MTTKPIPSLEFEGLGTKWIIELLGNELSFDNGLKETILKIVKEFNDAYTRFNDASLIGQLNTHKKLTSPPPELLSMFAFAHKLHDISEGAFNISVGASLNKLGYGSTAKAGSVHQNFWNETNYNSSQITIPAETSVDLGGFGKGWLIDTLGVLLEQHGYTHYLINGGGDILVTAQQPLELGLEHPYDSSTVIGTTRLTKGALAVSSTIKRQWRVGGKTHHHIIDPITDTSSTSPVVSSYVRGATALIADAVSTIVLLRPELQAKMEQHFGVQIIMLRHDQLEG
ncbi:MAG: FAD:protein FMN transferase [Candidatus Saccharimonadales bacterium]